MPPVNTFGERRIFKPRLYREARVTSKLTLGELDYTEIMVPHCYGIIAGATSSNQHFKAHQCTLAEFICIDCEPHPVEEFDWKSGARVRADAIAEGRVRDMNLRRARARMDEQARKFKDRRIALW